MARLALTNTTPVEPLLIDSSVYLHTLHDASPLYSKPITAPETNKFILQTNQSSWNKQVYITNQSQHLKQTLDSAHEKTTPMQGHHKSVSNFNIKFLLQPLVFFFSFSFCFYSNFLVLITSTRIVYIFVNVFFWPFRAKMITILMLFVVHTFTHWIKSTQQCSQILISRVSGGLNNWQIMKRKVRGIAVLQIINCEKPTSLYSRCIIICTEDSEGISRLHSYLLTLHQHTWWLQENKKYSTLKLRNKYTSL